MPSDMKVLGRTAEMFFWLFFGVFIAAGRQLVEGLSEPHRFDLTFLLRQSVLLTLLVSCPLLVVAGLSRRRRILLPIAVAAAGLQVFVLYFALRHSGTALWLSQPVPYQPFRVGPSDISLGEITPFLGITVWLPVAVLYGIHVWRPIRIRTGAAVGWCALYCVLSTVWVSDYLAVTEVGHEDTLVADGFSQRGWSQVMPGMTRAQVVSILGAPLSLAHRPHWVEQNAELWAYNWSAGYFAVAWFDDGRVARTKLGYSD